jgi:LPXTG-motif cell wall-anchored protein
VAILAGVIVLGERVTVWTVLGFALVLAGSWLVTRRRREAVPVISGADGADRRAA